MKNIFQNTRIGVILAVVLAVLSTIFVFIYMIGNMIPNIQRFIIPENYNQTWETMTFQNYISLFLCLLPYVFIFIAGLIINIYVIVKEIKWANRCLKTIKKSKAYNNNKKVRS